MTEKALAKMLLQTCITSYFDPVTHRMNDSSYLPDGKFKPDFAGSVEDYSMCESHEWFTGGNECGFTWTKIIDGKPTFGVTTRGTYNLLGWILNFMAGNEDEPELNNTPWDGKPTSTHVEVHYGFHFGVQCIFDEILKRTRYAINNGYENIILTAHSRASAMSQGIAVGLQKVLGEMEGLITRDKIRPRLFASPRYFNRAGVVSYNKRVPDTVLYRNANDPVCNTPPDWMNFGQVKTERRINFNWWNVPLDLIGGIPVIGTGISLVGAADHYPMHYMEQLDKLPGE